MLFKILFLSKYLAFFSAISIHSLFSKITPAFAKTFSAIEFHEVITFLSVSGGILLDLSSYNFFSASEIIFLSSLSISTFLNKIFFPSKFPSLVKLKFEIIFSASSLFKTELISLIDQVKNFPSTPSLSAS